MPPWAWPTRLQGLHPAGAALPQGGLLPQCAPCSLPACSGTCTLSLAPQQDPLAFPRSPGHLGRGRATSPCLHFTLRANETPLPGNGLLRVVFVTAPALAHGITDSCWTLERERLLGGPPARCLPKCAQNSAEGRWAAVGWGPNYFNYRVLWIRTGKTLTDHPIHPHAQGQMLDKESALNSSRGE